jgi:trehalose-6-phosphate synthase
LPEFKKAGMKPSSNNNDANDNNELFIPGKYYKSLNFLSFYAKFMRNIFWFFFFYQISLKRYLNKVRG